MNTAGFRNPGSRLRLIAVGLALLLAGAAAGQTPASLSLAERQRSILTRVQRLEDIMLKLSKSLEAREPEKAERLRSALEQAGKSQLKSRLETLVALLRSEKLSDADSGQSAVLKELDALMKLLTTPTNEIDERREERRALEKIKRQIRELIERQTENNYRTRRAKSAQEQAEGDGAKGAPQGEASPEALRKLEQSQRETQRSAADVAKQMQGDPAAGKSEKPGGESMRQASEQMRQAADKLGQQKPGDAIEQQESAVENLQNALDELDDALRQVRKEETEETLAALETRLREMLAAERQLKADVEPAAADTTENRAQADRAAIAAAARTQRDLADQCESTLRIVVDEGTTVIVPELIRQIAGDMSDVALRLENGNASKATVERIDQVISGIEEILGAVERRRDEQRKEEQQQQSPPSNDGQQPLLPASAELKLLRAAQVRLNERTPSPEAAAGDPNAAAEAQSLSKRQAQLVDLARRMNERD
ncbi:MAG: hypothetical protein AMXMBFR47_45940 [Planctomycetota bacterium]